MNKTTVGQLYLENMAKNVNNDMTLASDITKPQLSECEKEVWDCYYKNKDRYKHDFALVVLLLNHRAMDKMKRAKYFTRHTVPSPDYDQIVFYCRKNKDIPEYLWTVPDIETCNRMMAYKYQVPPEEYGLLQHVLDFYDGTLLKKAKFYNNEPFDTGCITITDAKG
jgi:hypothetical protein